MIIYPLPYLTKFLLLLTEIDRDKGISEIEFVFIRRPAQRKAAFNALLQLMLQDLSKSESINTISNSSKTISFMFSFEGILPKESSKILRDLEDLSIYAKNDLDASTNLSKAKNLENFENDIINLKKNLIVMEGSSNAELLSLLEKWLQIVSEEKKQFTKIKNTDYYIFDSFFITFRFYRIFGHIIPTK
ncbi:MAG: hypothetical protein QG646_1968 [Euryarchaeota archaeon]|nr:hypothetical protein [Euryarchaeota archaeon]